MKTPMFCKVTLGLGLAMAPFAGGCLPEATNQPPVQTAAIVESGANPAVPAALSPINAPTVEGTNATDLANAPIQVLSTNKTVPPNVRSTGPLAEVIKLANSGVDERVMMTFVTNSTGTFNLSAEEIIYLNDIGVSGTVVTAMIQRDQALKAQYAASAAAAAPASQPEVTQEPPPPAEEQVAPQPDGSATTYPVAPPPEEVTSSTFYEPLQPYGTWVNVGGYGYCWRPTVAVVTPGWQPYFNCGHWVYTDYGWYWMSDYSWGWAPFHYGRWFHHNHYGWCWAPDTVWGPSWVSWRYTDAYCGWAALPPGAYFSFGIGLTFHGHPVHGWDDCGLGPSHYRFVAWNHFHDRHPYHYAVPHDRVPDVYRHSTVATRIHSDGGRVVNNGLPAERVAAKTHTQMRPVALKDAGPALPDRIGRAERMDPNGKTLTVYRPQISEPHTQTRPAATAAVRRPGEVGHGAESLTDSRMRPDGGVSRPAGPSTVRVTEPTVSAGRPAPFTRSAGSRTVARPGNSPTVSSGNNLESSTRPAPNATATARPKAEPGVANSRPSSSVTVIGRRDVSRPQAMTPSTSSPGTQRLIAENDPPSAARRADASAATVAPSQNTSPASRPSPTPAWQNRPAGTSTTTPSVNRPQTPAPTRNYDGAASPNPAPTYRAPAAPTYRAPATPTYQAPARAEVPRYNPSPTPSYSTPRSYSPPPSAPASPRPSVESRSAPPPSSPAPARPAPAAPSSSSGGGGSRSVDRNQR